MGDAPVLRRRTWSTRCFSYFDFALGPGFPERPQRSAGVASSAPAEGQLVLKYPFLVKLKSLAGAIIGGAGVEACSGGLLGNRGKRGARGGV